MTLRLVLALACSGGLRDGDGEGDGRRSTHGNEHCGTVSDEEVWAADLSPHTVSCFVNIRGGSVRITEGTEVVFTNGLIGVGSGISVSPEGKSGTLLVTGTRENPVTLHGELREPGNWNGIDARAGGEVSITGAEISDGGGYNLHGCLTVDEGADVFLEDATLSNCDERGLVLREDAILAEGSHNLALVGNVGPAAEVFEAGIASFPTEGLLLEGNVDDGVRVDRARIRASMTWPALGYPWLMESGIGVEDATATVTLQPGVELRFVEAPARAIRVKAGTLVAVGTAEAPIVFRSTSEVPGLWSGLSLEGEGVATLEYVDIGYGGGGEFGSIYLGGGSLVVRDSFVHDSAACGIEFETGVIAAVGVTYANNAGGDYCE